MSSDSLGEKQKPGRSRVFSFACLVAALAAGWLVWSRVFAEHSSSPSFREHDMSGSMKRVVGYFPNWGIYDRKFRPQDIDMTPLTHVLYAFANVNGDGEVVLSDKWADEEIHWEGDSWNDSGKNVYGCFKQFYLLKKQHRHIKLLLSIGGWTYSQNGCFKKPVSDAKARKRFVESSLKLLEDYGLDGIDVDFEFPSNAAEASGYVDLLREMREGLDEHARRKGEHSYELTAATPCGGEHMVTLRIAEMDRYLSFWNLMAYDFSGSWSPVADHQANLFDRGGPNALSVDRAIRHYVAQGVPTHKLVIGMPLYGRSFANTNGLGHRFDGVGQGSWEAGSIDFKAMPRPGAQIQFDPQLVASWSYDPSKREFVTFDSVENAEAKADHIARNGLGGAMFWELSADFPAGHPQAMVPRVSRRLGQLDWVGNHLNYSGSKFDNLRNGMP